MKTSRLLTSLSLAAALICSAAEPLVPHNEAIVLPNIAFPKQLLRHGVTRGEAHLMLKIGPDGSLLDTLVTAYTHKGFAEAAVAALPRGTFRPRQVENQPVTTLLPLIVRFEVNGLLVVERYATDDTEPRPGVFTYRPCNPARLDQPLQTITAPSPGYPADLRQQGVRGQVIVEYYIDESGRVRMAEVIRTENDLLSGLILEAVEQWQFAPPVCKGRPVLVRVRQAFVFAPPETS